MTKKISMGRMLSMKRIVHTVVAVIALMLAVNTAGVGIAVADPFTGNKYADALKLIQGMGAKAVIATVVGSRLPTNDCIVTQAQKSNPRDAMGATKKVEYRLDLDCNAQLAQPGTPGFSAASPEGRKQKSIQTTVDYINSHPDFCNQSAEVHSNCVQYCTTLAPGKCTVQLD